MAGAAGGVACDVADDPEWPGAGTWWPRAGCLLAFVELGGDSSFVPPSAFTLTVALGRRLPSGAPVSAESAAVGLDAASDRFIHGAIRTNTNPSATRPRTKAAARSTGELEWSGTMTE